MTFREYAQMPLLISTDGCRWLKHTKTAVAEERTARSVGRQAVGLVL